MQSDVRRILLPLARFLVARGLPFAEAADWLRQAYVDAAIRIAGAAGEKATDSRLSLLTGMQRREIVTLRSRPAPPARRPGHLARLVAQWQRREGYCRDGIALDLPRRGAAPSFEALARDIRRDLHPRTMLDALRAAGTVVLDEASDRVRLAATSYQPAAGSGDQIAYLGANVGDHLEAAVANVLGPGPRRYERAAHFDGLTEAQVAELETRFRAAQQALLEEIGRTASAMQDEAAGSGKLRFRAGGYFWAEPSTDGGKEQP